MVYVFSQKQAYHVQGPLPLNPLLQLAESKVLMGVVNRMSTFPK